MLSHVLRKSPNIFLVFSRIRPVCAWCHHENVAICAWQTHAVSAMIKFIEWNRIMLHLWLDSDITHLRIRNRLSHASTKEQNGRTTPWQIRPIRNRLSHPRRNEMSIQLRGRYGPFGTGSQHPRRNGTSMHTTPWQIWSIRDRLTHPQRNETSMQLHGRYGSQNESLLCHNMWLYLL